MAQIQLPGKWFHSYVKLSEFLQCLLLLSQRYLPKFFRKSRGSVVDGSPVWPVPWLQEYLMASAVPDGEE